MGRFGVEEEFVLLDEESLVPLALGDAIRKRIADESTLGTVSAEYLTCQLECITDPVTTMPDAERQLRHLRGLLGAHAAARSAIAAASGTPFASTRTSAVSPSPHYDDVAVHLAHISREHEVNGLHVHVEVGDDEERVRALNRVRGWLPVLLALSGNSPFVDGVHSGFASWRSIVIRRLPSSWSPPRFHDFDDYRAHVAQLVDLKVIPEAASLAWAVRLSERFPTVELRVFDAQLQTEETLFAAALSRAIVLTDDRISIGELDGIDASLWMAARRGMDARVIDPTTGAVADAWQVAGRMLDAIRPALAELGDEDLVDEHLERIHRHGTGAQRQSRAFDRDGVAGLRRLYRDGTPALPL
ncbi:MAG: YbdK family carboxylate-amine ligase [Microbacterium sp.]|uniref:carboxylate-amine ligase n=1 Tax=Microbacterium sp. TaxID=51671 RepID=UPI003BAEA0B3